MTAARVIPYCQAHIVPCLQGGSSVLVSAHGNSLRAIFMHLEQTAAGQIVALGLPTGTPYIYRFDAAMRPIEKRALSGETHVG
jgi:2,3-bisphosphoglycerate-dependent phosphoglycerate mutase